MALDLSQFKKKNKNMSMRGRGLKDDIYAWEQVWQLFLQVCPFSTPPTHLLSAQH